MARRVFIDCIGGDGASVRHFLNGTAQSYAYDLYSFVPDPSVFRSFDQTATLVHAHVGTCDHPGSRGGAGAEFPTIDLSRWLHTYVRKGDHIQLAISYGEAELAILQHLSTQGTLEWIDMLYLAFPPGIQGAPPPGPEAVGEGLAVPWHPWDPSEHGLAFTPGSEQQPQSDSNRRHRRLRLHGLRQAGPKMVVYTTMAGREGPLCQPNVVNPHVRYVCFADGPLAQPGAWETQPMERVYQSARRDEKRHQLLPHLLFPGVDYSLYVDPELMLTADPLDLVEQNLAEAEMALPADPRVNCVYKAATRAIAEQPTETDCIRKLMSRYKLVKYPQSRGMISTAVILRRHTPEVLRLGEAWWQLVQTYTLAEHLAFPFAARRFGVPCTTLPADVAIQTHFADAPTTESQ